MGLDYSFFIDGQPYDNPQGWEQIDIVLRRDRTYDALLCYQDANVIFYGDAYDYLESLRTQGFCSKANVEVVRDGVVMLRSVIFIADTEFREQQRAAVVKLKDDNFYAKINNNKNVKTSVTGIIDKAGNPIAAVTKYNLGLYDTSGVAIHDVYAIRVYDVFQWYVNFMTGSSIAFASDTFNYGGEWEGLCITSGVRLSSPTFSIYSAGLTPFPVFSFDTLMKEIKKRIPIGFTIENPLTYPTLRVEVLSYFEQGNSSYVFEDIDEIVARFDNQRLYSSVNVGNNITDSNVVLSFPESVALLGYGAETYHLQGDCSIDLTLELATDWCATSNVIEASIQNLPTENNSNIFLIDSVVTSVGNGDIALDNFFGFTPPVYFYNARLRNSEIIARYSTGMPSSVILNQSADENGLFDASLSADVTTPSFIYDPFPFDVATLNTGGYFNVATYKFTAASVGLYRLDVRTNLAVQLASLGIGYAAMRARIMVKDSGGTVLTSYIYVDDNFLQAFSTTTETFYNFTTSEPIVLNAGDVAYVLIEMISANNITYRFPKEFNTFQCTDTSNGSIIANTVDADDYPILTYSFEIPMLNTDFDTMQTEIAKAFRFYSDSDLIRRGWIDEVRYNYFTGVASVKLFTTKNSENAT